MKIVSFKIDDDLLVDLDAYSDRMMVSRSVVIRKALEVYLKYGGDPKKKMYIGKKIKIYPSVWSNENKDE